MTSFHYHYHIGSLKIIIIITPKHMISQIADSFTVLFLDDFVRYFPYNLFVVFSEYPEVFALWFQFIHITIFTLISGQSSQSSYAFGILLFIALVSQQSCLCIRYRGYCTPIKTYRKCSILSNTLYKTSIGSHYIFTVLLFDRLRNTLTV